MTSLLLMAATNSISAPLRNRQISFGDLVIDTIRFLGEVDTLTFTGQAGEHVIIRLDPDGVDTYFRGMLELYSPSDSLLKSAYDSWTNPNNAL